MCSLIGLKYQPVRLVSLGKTTKSTQWIAGFWDKIRIQDHLNMKQCHPLKHDHQLYLVLEIGVRTKFERKTGGGPSCQPACGLFLFNFEIEIFIRIYLVINFVFRESNTRGCEFEGSYFVEEKGVIIVFIIFR
jgi:hypothetical protein